MWMNWNAAGLLAVAAVAYVLYAHWETSRRAWPAWTLRLGGSRRAFLRWLRLNTGGQLEMLAATLRLAHTNHAQGDDEGALHAIGHARALAALHVRLLRRWLQCWSDVARLLGLSPASQPPRRLPTGTTVEPRWLAWAGHVGDLVLPTHASRFHFSVQVQRTRLRCAGWSAGAAHQRAQEPGQIADALDDLEAAHAALAVFDEQAFTTLEHVLHVLPHDQPTG